METYNWKAKPISPCLGAHEAHPKTTLYGVVFQKLNGPLLTSAPQSPSGQARKRPAAGVAKRIGRGAPRNSDAISALVESAGTARLLRHRDPSRSPAAEAGFSRIFCCYRLCKAAMPNTFMKQSLTRQAEPDQAAQGTTAIRSHQLPARRWPTRCGSSCTPVPTGCYSTCVLQSRVGIRCGTQSSPRFVCVS